MVGSASGVGTASALPFGFAIGRAYGVGAASAGPVGFAVGSAAGIGAMSGVPPGPWTPADISTLLWLDADDAATFTFGTGTNVAAWADKSGNGNHFIQATGANQPNRETVTNIINGLPVVSYTNTNSDVLQRLALAGWPADSSTVITLAGVYRHRATFGAHFDISINTNTNITGLAFPETSFIIELRREAQSAFSPAAAITINAPYQAAFTLKDTKLEIFINGALVGSNATSGTTRAYTNMRLGMLFQDVFPLHGEIGEFVVVSGDTDATRELIEGYLAWKWGLEGDLPGGHPYKNAPP